MADPGKWWSGKVASNLELSGTNRQELTQALERTSVDQREGIQFLLENMPLRDLQTLSSDFLIENISLAYKGLQEAPWAKSIPKERFLNDVLPYASMTERRDNWRKRLYEISIPLVKDCKTAAAAGQALNQKLFALLKVRYSRTRRAPDQGPIETMESGVATCTGLSILLVDACRAVGVPARIVGTPLWSNHNGNHTWVEIWDGDWHFTGAAEQSPEGLDRGWFVGNASQAVKDDRDHAIYASSFQMTGLIFPLTWARRADYVHAVNITDRYAPNSKPIVNTGLKLTVDVYERPVGQRIASKVMVTDAANQTVRFEGVSKGETADMNDHLMFDLPKQRTYLVETEGDEKKIRQYYTTGTNNENRLAVFLSGIPPVLTITNYYLPMPVSKRLVPEDEAQLKESLTKYFLASPDEQASWKFPDPMEELLRNYEPAIRLAAWESFRTAPIHQTLRHDFDAKQVRFDKHLSPYTTKTVGKRPATGWALFIAMHGGGGAPQALNDSQWRQMQNYYRDHPEAGGYIYLALRAPNNEWNGFYAGYVYPLIENLRRQFLLFGDVDPNKIFIMGYSHGGYGAFAIGPKMPDRFAAIHASAAAPADGAEPITLRNTVFTCMVGSKDTMYGRYDRVRNFEKEIQKLRGGRTDIYPVTVQIIADHPHAGLPDRDKIAEMYSAVRNPVPGELTWRMTDGVIRDFFWLNVPEPGPGKQLDVSCRDNHIVATATTNLTNASILLDSRLIDFNQSVSLEFNGKTSRWKLKPSLLTLCKTMQRRADPELSFTAEISLPDVANAMDYKAIFNAPPRDVPTKAMPGGPLLGNGDVGVVLAGPSEAQRFHIGKNDFWTRTPGDAKVITVGTVKLFIPALKGSSYRQEQDLACAEVRGTFTKDGLTVRTRSWVDAHGNFLFTQVQCDGLSIALSVQLSVGEENAAHPSRLADSVTLGGARNSATNWFSRKADNLPGRSRDVAVATRIIGADGLDVEINPGETITVATTILSDLDSADFLTTAKKSVAELTVVKIEAYLTEHRDWWAKYWARSFIEIPDKEIEKHWYAALYTLGSCSRPGKVAPGLWGNWLTTDHPGWHGDFHLNYNFQAPYYLTYGANHADLSLPFYQAILESMENGRAMAKRHGWKGVHFPVCIGPWGLSPENSDGDWGQRSNAAYAALNFIWHWQYTQDADFLRRVIYPYLSEVATFWEDYLKFENGRYVIYNDSIHEGSGPDFNPILSLGLVKTLFKNMVSLSEELVTDGDKRAKWQHIYDKLSDFPLQERNVTTIFRYSEKGMAWNDGNTLGIQHIFPSGAIGLDSDPKLLAISRNMIDAMHRWTDGNGFSSWYTACARIGYDPKRILEGLRHECNTRSAPNLLLQYGGGGIENCSGFLAVNEMLLQSHEGVIRLFPCWPKEMDAKFGTLRTVNAFLVSAENKNGKISCVKIFSEKGRPCTIVNPWPGMEVKITRNGDQMESVSGNKFTLKTSVSEMLELKPVQ